MRFLTLKEIASMMHHKPRWVSEVLIRGGFLKAAKIGKSWLIRESDFNAFCERWLKAKYV